MCFVFDFGLFVCLFVCFYFFVAVVLYFMGYINNLLLIPISHYPYGDAGTSSTIILEMLFQPVYLSDDP